MPPRIAVETGVVIPDEHGHSHSQVLDDAIKISIIPDGDEPLDVSRCHFLQFITRQAPDMFRANLPAPMFGVEPGIAWETADTHYMDNPNIAKWRVDSNTHPNPFYDEGGAHEHGSDGSYSMYDQPAYSPTTDEFERIIGCTFVIVNEQVIGQVSWSRQYILDEQELSSQYRYEVDDTVTEIPDWAIHCLNDEYRLNASIADDDAHQQRAYAIPAFITRNPLMHDPIVAQTAMNQELQKSPTPENWALQASPKFSILMTPPAAIAHEEEKHDEAPNPATVYREITQSRREQASLNAAQPDATDIQNDASSASHTNKFDSGV